MISDDMAYWPGACDAHSLAYHTTASDLVEL